MYQITFSDIAEQQIDKLNPELRQRIISTIKRCHIRPYIFAKKIVGTHYFALRAGDYRIIIRIFNKEIRILVVKVGHRKKIYKQLS